MRQIVLPGTAISVSRLSFGTASLHHLTSSPGRQDLLAASFDHGFTHFDTAPSYGYGIAEEELGRFIVGRRGRVTVTTKIGLYAPRGARPATVSVWARKVAGQLLPGCSRLVVDWSVEAASHSLHRSLRRLRIEQIDLLLLHEPVHGALDADACLAWLHQQQSTGRIRTWGLAGPAEAMGPWVSNREVAPVLQVRDSQARREADFVTGARRELQITYGYLSAGRASYGGDEALARLRWALQRNRTGSILVSSRNIDRVAQLARAAEELA